MAKGIYKRSKKEKERLRKMCRENGFKNGYFVSDEIKKKMREIAIKNGRKPPSRRGVKHSEETKRKMRMRKHTQETRKKMSEAHKGEKAYNWIRNKVGYGTLHSWARRELGKPKQCFICGIIGKKNGRNWSIHWANKSGNYKRDKNDWIALCIKCHKKYDSQNCLEERKKKIKRKNLAPH